VELLLEKGANINVQGGQYGSALQAALFGGWEGLVKLLIDKGAILIDRGTSLNAEYWGAIKAAA
jgi:ankyrin repeat protein